MFSFRISAKTVIDVAWPDPDTLSSFEQWIKAENIRYGYDWTSRIFLNQDIKRVQAWLTEHGAAQEGGSAEKVYSFSPSTQVRSLQMSLASFQVFSPMVAIRIVFDSSSHSDAVFESWLASQPITYELPSPGRYYFYPAGVEKVKKWLKDNGWRDAT